MSPKTVRASVIACALVLAPGLLFAEPDRDGRRGRREPDRRARVEHRGHRHAPAPVLRPVVARCDDDHRRHHRRCGCVEVVIPGYYRTVVETVRTPGYYKEVWVPAPRIRLGRHVEVGLPIGHYERIWVPGECREVERKIWVPARTVLERCRGHRH